MQSRVYSTNGFSSPGFPLSELINRVLNPPNELSVFAENSRSYFRFVLFHIGFQKRVERKIFIGGFARQVHSSVDLNAFLRGRNYGKLFFGKYGQTTIVSRLKPLEDVGLGYIKLGQNSSTLSGGENQRVKLAYFIGQERVEPSLFIFDEPTTGLHFHDIQRLLTAFDALIARGHTILVIEHNMEVIKCADWVIDLGPEGGDKGGTVVVTGTPEEVAQCKESHTGYYMKKILRK